MAAKDALTTTLNLDGFKNIPLKAFDRKALKKAYRESGRIIQQDAKRRINVKARQGNYPSKRTGRLVKSLKVKVSRPGLLAKVYHAKLADQKHFYAAFLHYGTKDRYGSKDGKSRGRITANKRNYITDALNAHADEIYVKLQKAMFEALG